MNVKSIVVIFVLSVIFFACSSSSEKSSDIKFTFKDFPKKEVLKGKIYTYPEILMPNRIVFKNNKLIVSDRSGLALLHRVDAKLMKYESELAQMGWGPGEIPNISSIDKGLSNDTFWIYSGMGKLFAEYNLTDSTNLFKKVIRQKDNWNLAIQNIIVNDNSYLGFMVNDDDQFVLFDSLGNKKGQFGKWSEIMPDLSYNTYLISDLHYGDLIGNPRSGIFVLAGIRTDRIDIIDINKNSLKTIKGPVDHFPEYKINRSNGEEVIIIDSYTQMLTYNTGDVGENQIYLAYLGKNRMERKPDENVKDILVLDFEGKPIVHYELDISILNLSVDEKNRKIYGTTIGEDPGIVVFDF